MIYVCRTVGPSQFFGVWLGQDVPVGFAIKASPLLLVCKGLMVTVSLYLHQNIPRRPKIGLESDCGGEKALTHLCENLVQKLFLHLPQIPAMNDVPQDESIVLLFSRGPI